MNILAWENRKGGIRRGFLPDHRDTALFMIVGAEGAPPYRLWGAVVPDHAEANSEYQSLEKAQEAAERYLRVWLLLIGRPLIEQLTK